ncbi:hypothetical protein [Amycolatopsis sp. cmx-8-4]|uniref:hypothetical protein n=1 Tax=Amycolatopsis sp. cmx-8-4 TaxID=2790947 RepID=UPI00397E14EA
MKITTVQVLENDTIDRFYDFFRAAFDPMRSRAAARHMLTAEEFAADMFNARVDKYIAWDNDRAVGLFTLTNDLSAVPWIEPEFYGSRHPEQLARGALFYLGYILVDPRANATPGVIKAMTDAALRRCAESGGVLAFDLCTYNADRVGGRFIAGMLTNYGVRAAKVDVQSYYLADFADTPAQMHEG